MSENMMRVLEEYKRSLEAVRAENAAIKTSFDELKLKSERMQAVGSKAEDVVESYKRAMSDYIRHGEYRMSADSRKFFQERATLVGNSEDAGFVAMTETLPGVRMMMSSADKIRSLATVVNTSASSTEVTREIGTEDDLDNWTGEGKSAGTEGLKFGKIILTPKKLKKYVPISEEMVADARFDITQYATEKLTKKFDRYESYAFVRGKGASTPKGILSGISAKNENLMAGGKITNLDKLLDLQAMQKDYDDTSMFFMSRKTLNEIKKFKATDGHYIWSESMSKGLPGEYSGFLEEKPVVLLNNLPDLGSAEPCILYGDMREYYMIADRQTMSISVNTSDGEKMGMVNVYGTRRVDAAPIMTEAMVGMTASVN